MSTSELNYEVGAVVAADNGVVTNLDFHREGRHLVMSTSESHSLYLIDALAGVEKKKLFCKATGLGLVRYTHHEACVLISADAPKDRKLQGDIRYLCMHDNRYLRYFKGHTERVSSLSMSPIDDTFLSASSDGSVRQWALNTPQAICKMQLPPNVLNPQVAFDCSGACFGIMGQDANTLVHCIKLYDARNYTSGPFNENIAPSFALCEAALQKANPYSNPHQTKAKLRDTAWTSFEFSPDGFHLLVNTHSDFMLVLDGYQNENRPVAITNRKNDAGAALQVRNTFCAIAQAHKFSTPITLTYTHTLIHTYTHTRIHTGLLYARRTVHLNRK